MVFVLRIAVNYLKHTQVCDWRMHTVRTAHTSYLSMRIKSTTRSNLLQSFTVLCACVCVCLCVLQFNSVCFERRTDCRCCGFPSFHISIFQYTFFTSIEPNRWRTCSKIIKCYDRKLIPIIYYLPKLRENLEKCQIFIETIHQKQWNN